MSTFMAKPAEVQRKWYIIDAADRPLGRTATKVADILRGKLKTVSRADQGKDSTIFTMVFFCCQNRQSNHKPS